MATTASVARRAGRGTAPQTRNLGLALVVIAIAQLMVVLDTAIVNIALPSIQRALHFTPTGYRELGKRYGQQMLALLRQKPAPAATMNAGALAPNAMAPTLSAPPHQ